MPTISGPIATVSNLTQPVQHARLYLEAARPNGNGIVTSFPETLPVTGGTLTFECVEGPAVLELVSAGSRPDRVPILVGKDAEQTLASVAQAAVLADGHTQDQLAEIVDSIRRNRVASEQAAVTATDAIGTVTAARDATLTARNATITARNEAVAAGEAATGAKNTATTARDDALTARNETEGFKAQAATSAGEAAASAGAASDAADRAENVVDTVQWQGDQLSVMGKVSPPLTGDDGDTPHVGANGNWWVGDTDTGVQAQGPKGDPGDGNGDVLWSELNPVLDGKAAASHSHSVSEVSGLGNELDSKSDKTHKLEDHPDWPGATPEVTGQPNTLVKRDGSGRFYVTTPEYDYQPTTKIYVDSLVSAAISDLVGDFPEEVAEFATLGALSTAIGESLSMVWDELDDKASTAQVEARTPEIRTVSSPEMATSPGVLYVVMDG